HFPDQRHVHRAPARPLRSSPRRPARRHRPGAPGYEMARPARHRGAGPHRGPRRSGAAPARSGRVAGDAPLPPVLLPRHRALAGPRRPRPRDLPGRRREPLSRAGDGLHGGARAVFRRGQAQTVVRSARVRPGSLDRRTDPGRGGSSETPGAGAGRGRAGRVRGARRVRGAGNPDRRRHPRRRRRPREPHVPRPRRPRRGAGTLPRGVLAPSALSGPDARVVMATPTTATPSHAIAGGRSAKRATPRRVAVAGSANPAGAALTLVASRRPRAKAMYAAVLAPSPSQMAAAAPAGSVSHLRSPSGRRGAKTMAAAPNIAAMAVSGGTTSTRYFEARVA